MRSPLSYELIEKELDIAIGTLTKIRDDLGQWPGVDLPGSEEQYFEHVKRFAAELYLIAKKCDTIATITLGDVS